MGCYTHLLTRFISQTLQDAEDKLIGLWTPVYSEYDILEPAIMDILQRFYADMVPKMAMHNPLIE